MGGEHSSAQIAPQSPSYISVVPCIYAIVLWLHETFVWSERLMVAEACGDTGTVVLNTTLRQSLTLKTSF